MGFRFVIFTSVEMCAAAKLTDVDGSVKDSDGVRIKRFEQTRFRAGEELTRGSIAS